MQAATPPAAALTPLRALERLCSLSALAREQLRALVPDQKVSDFLGGFISAAQPALREVASRLISEVRSARKSERARVQRVLS